MKKRDKYLDLARELKKLWNMKAIVVGVLGTIPKGLLVKGLEDLEIRGQVETTALLRSARILRKVLFVTQIPVEKPSTNAGVKNSQRI